MEDQSEPQQAAGEAGVDDGTGAVLYGMFTSFTEVLGSLEGRLAAIERSVGELSELVRAQATAPPVEWPRTGGTTDEEIAAAVTVMRAQGALLDQRSAALAAAVEALHQLLQAHVDDTAHSLGRRATDAGRRLAGDLGLRGRPKPPAGS